ncbi:hypothetical protein [uncultured Roseobacter sp.]|nr:hypothetical protein [uncultured Roseobacter sp.]
MREMVLAALAMAVISVGAFYGLHEAGFSAADRTAGQAVRLSD